MIASRWGALSEETQVGQEHVLVVDDEPMIRMIIADSLNEAGLQVIEASSADEALSVLDSGSPVRTLITDVRMPGRMDGLDLAEVVTSRWDHIAVVVISGHANLHDPRLPKNASFLAKPFKRDDLLKHVISA